MTCRKYPLLLHTTLYFTLYTENQFNIFSISSLPFFHLLSTQKLSITVNKYFLLWLSFRSQCTLLSNHHLRCKQMLAPLTSGSILQYPSWSLHPDWALASCCTACTMYHVPMHCTTLHPDYFSMEFWFPGPWIVEEDGYVTLQWECHIPSCARECTGGQWSRQTWAKAHKVKEIFVEKPHCLFIKT